MCIILVIMANGKLSYCSSETGFPLGPAPGLVLCFLPLGPLVCLASVRSIVHRAMSSIPSTNCPVVLWGSSLRHLLFHGSKFQRNGGRRKPTSLGHCSLAVGIVGPWASSSTSPCHPCKVPELSRCSLNGYPSRSLSQKLHWPFREASKSCSKCSNAWQLYGPRCW